MPRKTAARLTEVSQEEHEQTKERYNLALSGVDEAIQSVRESRAKVRQLFRLELADAEK